MAFSRISFPLDPASRLTARLWSSLLPVLVSATLLVSSAAQHRPAHDGELPRQALLLVVTDDPANEALDPGDLPETRWFRTPLQHLGLELLPRRLSATTPRAAADELPDAPVLVWIGGGATVPGWLPAWLLERAQRQRLVLLGDPDRLQDAATPTVDASSVDAGSVERLWRRLGFAALPGFVDDPLRIDVVLAEPGMRWFESPPRRSPLHRGTRSLDADHRVWVQTVDRCAHGDDLPVDGDRRDHVVTGRFGGLARQPFLLEPGDDRLAPRWHLDPLRFFATALGLDDAPIPDPHVVHGRRVLHLSVGSEGLPGRSTFDDGRMNADVLLDRLLDVHRLPVTVSVDPTSLLQLEPAERDELVQSLRRLAARPFVEFALDSSLASGRGDDDRFEERLDARARTSARLSELDTARRRLEAWSGARIGSVTWRTGAGHDDAPDAAEQLTRAVHTLGLTAIPIDPFRRDDLHPSLLGVPPLGWTTADGAPTAAVRAPLEALYPRFYTELPGAFRHAETTLLRTDQPTFRIAAALRAQFHTAERPARLAAFDRLLDAWTRGHDTCVLFTDQHLAAARDVLDPQRCRSVRVGDEGWDFSGFVACRTLRFERSAAPPAETEIDRLEIDWDRSPGVVGARRIGSTLWIELGAADAALRWLDAGHRTAPRPHLEQADRPLRGITRDAAGITCEFDLRCGPPTLLIAAGFPADTALRWSAQPGGGTRALRSDALGRVRVELQTVWTGEDSRPAAARRLRIEVAP